MNEFGPTPREASLAFWVAHHADQLLNAYLESGRPKAQIVRNLVEALAELEGNTVGAASFEERAEELQSSDWSKALPESGEQPRFILPDPEAP